jgi:hypothetical protein
MTQMAGQKKFTREKVGQIRNLVENGKRRQEIAELIGVTVGSLQVTCSKLGISLRQRGRRLGDPVAVPDDGCSSDGRQSKREPPRQSSQSGPAEDARAATPHPWRASVGAATAKFAIRMQYNGEERSTDLPFTNRMVRRLALEAEARDLRIGEFLGELVMATMKKDLLQRVLAPDPSRASEQVQTPGRAKGSASARPTKVSEVSDRL